MKDGYYTIQPGMPVSMKELEERSKGLSLTKLVEYTENNTNACIITNRKGQMVQTVPILGSDISFIDLNLVRAKGWSVVIMPKKENKFTALSHSFWNCKCKTNNVHHKVMGRCPVCKKNATVQQMGYVEDALHDLKWKFVVGE